VDVVEPLVGEPLAGEADGGPLLVGQPAVARAAGRAASAPGLAAGAVGNGSERRVPARRVEERRRPGQRDIERGGELGEPVVEIERLVVYDDRAPLAGRLRVAVLVDLGVEGRRSAAIGPLLAPACRLVGLDGVGGGDAEPAQVLTVGPRTVYLGGEYPGRAGCGAGRRRAGAPGYGPGPG
jgi:hypothetical protein